MVSFERDWDFNDRPIFSRVAVIALCLGLVSEGYSQSFPQNPTKGADKMIPNIEPARSGKRMLPAGVSIPGEGLLPVPVDAMHSAEPDHVFLMNFSKDEAAVRRVIADLGAFSENRVYRMNSTVAEAFSDNWNVNRLKPMVTETIKQTHIEKNEL